MLIDGREYEEVPDGWALFWTIIAMMVVLLAAVGAGYLVKTYGG